MYFTLNARLQVPHSLLVLDGLDYQTAQQRIDDRTNCAAFWGAHLVDSRFFCARALGPLAESPFAAALDSARTIDEVVALPTLADIRREWLRSAELLEERFAVLTDAELGARARRTSFRFPIRACRA